MSELTTVPEIDKSGWGDGPWQTEPDRIEFEHAGLPCLMVRHPRLGHWCGYAAVPPGHPLHSKSMNDDVVSGLEVHGGVTYAHECNGRICHVPKPGEPDNVWWFGFDAGHCWDHSPGIKEMVPGLTEPLWPEEQYRDMAFIRSETEGLAEQLAEDQ